ncbi:MAG TPA: hypothetical protein VEB19_18970 [Gemmatimonadaceae bacterium]|nr:hypothetical protein [Gemmatimonadaceae bacterium]
MLPVLVLTSAVAACSEGPTRRELVTANAQRADSLFYLRNELLEQVMEGTRFVNEVNAELSKARNIGTVRQLKPGAELADANEERRQVVGKITILVDRLAAMQGRLVGMRKEVADKDSLLKTRIAEYEQVIAEAQSAAEFQRAQLQALIDEQTTRIASLNQQVDSLHGTVRDLTDEQNTVYFVVGTRKELIEKGVVVPNGSRRFLLAGARPVAPARDLDPSVFTKLDRRTDRTIILPDGEYRILSRQNEAYTTSEVTKSGKLAGALTIEQPERFWNGSRYLIVMKS